MKREEFTTITDSVKINELKTNPMILFCSKGSAYKYTHEGQRSYLAGLKISDQDHDRLRVEETNFGRGQKLGL